MLNVIVVNEESNILSLLSTMLKDNEIVKYHFFNSSESAVSFVESTPVSVTVLPVNMSIMDGCETAELIAQLQPEARFIFVYDDKEKANPIQLFNQFEGSRLISKNSLSKSILLLINQLIIEYDAESSLARDYEAYRIKEKNYQASMSNMSNILNERIECYKDISSLYSLSSIFLLKNNSNENNESIFESLEHEFNEYINMKLINKSDFNDSID